MSFKDKIISGLLSIIFVLAIITDWYDILLLILNFLIILILLDKLGNGIVLRETIALHGCIVTLFLPLIGYRFYDEDDSLSRLWVKYMPIPENLYFQFALPAMSGFVLALCWPIVGVNTRDTGKQILSIIKTARETLMAVPNVGLIILSIGVLSFFISPYLPVEIQFLATLFYFAAFSGFLYLYFIPRFPAKYFLIFLFGVFIILITLRSGMFSIIVYMSVTIMSYFFIGKKLTLSTKVLAFILGLSFIFIIQIVKNDYRKASWYKDFEGNRALLFADLVQKNVSMASSVRFSDLFFPMYTRGNQGFNVALVMRRYPGQVDFDRGDMLMKSFISSFVPRIFWPDKPEAGGKSNMLYYAGIKIEGWSTNVGPLGEAFASFGKNGGILFMILLGVLIRFSYRLFLNFSSQIPLLIFWMPTLYYQVTYSAESDTLQIFNSLLKSAIFIWGVYQFKPTWFGVLRIPYHKQRIQQIIDLGN